MMRGRAIFGLPWAMSIALCACPACSHGPPRSAFTLSEPTLQIRERSTRRFDTTDELMLLRASAALLQDLGFTIEESELPLGLIVATKDRSAVEGRQVAGKVAMLLLFRKNVAIDKQQQFRASLVTRPFGNQVIVRVTFQRVVWDENGRISKLERLDVPTDYQEFFDKLARSVFLEAHKI